MSKSDKEKEYLEYLQICVDCEKKALNTYLAMKDLVDETVIVTQRKKIDYFVAKLRRTKEEIDSDDK